ncbi:MAG TPA: autotransporter outer membrane beta-barrel domain-containing protein, partial [Caulobacteraceae bacterium]|nr:autotransporter outer membrane beta-barrel domain-containing protein [Caulobacteraceae bacterium]
MLIGAPTATPYQLATIPTAGQDIWYDTVGVWLDHQSDLRGANMAGGAGGEAGLWVRAVGDWTRRSQTSTYADLNRSYAFDSGYRLDVGGIVGGFDADRHDVFGKGDVLVVGIGGGYIGSTQNFHVGSTRGDYNGGSLEITGAYLRQNFFVDGAVKADFLNATISAPGAAPFGAGRASADLTNAGAIVDTGFRWGFGPGFVEPLVTLAYVNTSVVGLSLGGDGVSFGGGDNARVRVGVSGGWTLSQWNNYIVEAAVTGSYWARITGDASATINSGVGAPLFTVNDQQVRDFGEIGASLDATPLKNGVAGFLQFDYQFGAHYDAAQVKAGARIA